MADVVLLATADWDHPLWTNKQHVAVALAAEGNRVLYVESLGLRSAQRTGRDLKRILKRLRRGLRLPRLVQKGIWVWSPLVIPGGYNKLSLLLNRLSLRLGLRIALWRLRFRRPWLWTYNPLTTTLLDLSPFARTVYHAVDALHEQPCMPKERIETAERRLCAAVDQVFVTSPELERQLSPWSRRIRFDPNVADQDHFARAMTLSMDAIPTDLAEIPAPRIGFMGAVSSYKLDFTLIAAVARAHPQWQFVFIGPTGEGEPYTDITLLNEEPNVHLLGAKPYGQLPEYCAGFDCGWLPLRFTPYTQSMFPMKFFEYLAAGLPVVATSIDSLVQFSGVALLCEPELKAFSKALEQALSSTGASLDVRLALAAQHTYTARTRRMLMALETAS